MPVQLRERKIDGRTIVSPALGLMSIAGLYGETDDESSRELLRAAIKEGATNWDAADIYGSGRAERLVGDVLKETGARSQIFLATKIGNEFDEETGKVTGEVRGDRQYVIDRVEASIRRLGCTPDLMYIHRVDPKTPLEETFGTLEELRKQGKFEMIGISECSTATLRKVAKICKLSALQVEYSAWAAELEGNGLLDAARELGITVFGCACASHDALTPADSPIGRGLLSGTFKSSEDATKDAMARARAPRFEKEHFEKNRALAEAFGRVADKKGCTPSQLAIAYVAAQGEDIVPIAGSKRIERMKENFASRDLMLSDDELKQIRQVLSDFPTSGGRYNEAMLAKLGH